MTEISPHATPVLSYRHEGRIYHAMLRGEKRYKLGRSNESALDIPKSMNFVSRHHATIVEHDGRYFLEDNESRNGTFVNNKRIEHRAIINDGDILHLGWLEIAFQMRALDEEVSVIDSHRSDLMPSEDRKETAPIIAEDGDLIDDEVDVEPPLYYEESLSPVDEDEDDDLDPEFEEMIDRSTSESDDIDGTSNDDPDFVEPARKSNTFVSAPGKDSPVSGPPESGFQVNASIELNDFQKTKGFDSKIQKIDGPTEGPTVESNVSSQHFGPNQSWILSVFKNLTSKMIQTREKNEFFEAILNEIMSLVPAERGIVCLEREPGKFEPTVFLKKSDQSTTRLEISRTILNTAITRRNALLIEDTKSSEFSDEESIRDLDIFSAMCMPIISGENTFGVLYVDTSNPVIPFTETHLEIFSAIGSISAISLETIEARHAIEALLPDPSESPVDHNGVDAESASTGVSAVEPTEPYAADSTILFARYKPSHELYQSELPPDEVIGRVNDNLADFKNTIESMGGQIRVLAGTQVCGHFEKQDDFASAEAAMNAARQLIQNQKERFESAPDDQKFDLQVGIATGSVTVASANQESPEQLLLIGEAVEAAREFCMNVATAGEIITDLDTFLAVRDSMDCEPMSPVKLSMSSRAVPVFKVINPEE